LNFENPQVAVKQTATNITLSRRTDFPPYDNAFRKNTSRGERDAHVSWPLAHRLQRQVVTREQLELLDLPQNFLATPTDQCNADVTHQIHSRALNLGDR
jgi:hypothetical protein